MQIGKGKQGVLIGEYGGTREVVPESGNLSQNDTNPILGYVEPACDSPGWILFFSKTGDAYLYTKRGPDGATLDEATHVKAKA